MSLGLGLSMSIVDDLPSGKHVSGRRPKPRWLWFVWQLGMCFVYVSLTKPSGMSLNPVDCDEQLEASEMQISMTKEEALRHSEVGTQKRTAYSQRSCSL